MKLWAVAACCLILAGCLAPIDAGGFDAGSCGPLNCAGCCDANRRCQPGAADAQCGQGGAACGTCSSGSVCQANQCIASGCDLPGSIDWAAVARGDSAVRTIELKNRTAAAVIATIGSITNGAGFSNAGTGQTVQLVAGQTHTVELTFAPTELKAYSARVVVRVSDSCPDQVISLTGTGVDAVLSWAPDPLDCGYVTPGVQRVLETTFTNASAAPVLVSSLTTTSPEYVVTSSQPVIVPARGSAKVQVVVKPAALGPRNGRLDFQTGLPRQPSGSQELKCYGGGRDIDVNPTLDIGTVAYFAGSSASVNGRLTIQNLGTRPVPPDPKANLHLGTGGTANVFWSVRTKAVAGNKATVDELCVGDVVAGACTNAPVAGTYDSVLGIEAVGASALLDVPVRVTPRGFGLKEWEVLIHSDDPDESPFVVTIRADAILLPPCDFEVAPQALSFGLVAAGSPRELEVLIRNKGLAPTQRCLISGLALSPGSHPFFSLVGGPVASQFLAPGASLTVTVRYAPTGAMPAMLTSVGGVLQFSPSSPTGNGAIPLSATLGPACLSLVPNRFDFGTIQKSCNSATRTFLLYNTCAAALEVSASQLVQATAELTTVNTVGIATGTVINPGSNPATFSLKYQPVDDGRDTGAFVIKVKQGTQLVDYVIPLSGTGDGQGLNVDSLLLGGNLKADILLVIDDSGSMLDKQTSLGAGFPSFISHANAIGLDYQLGVTSSDMGVAGGRLIGTPKILTFYTPNLNSVFSQRVQLGTGGSPTEQLLAPATAAVTAPLVSTDNAGFVRPGATLGIVSVSDAEDQSPQTVSFYVNQLLNVKPPGRVTFSAIAPLQATSPIAGCTYDGAGGAPRTLAAVSALGGLSREICTPDWKQGLLDLGPSVFGAVFGASSFLLSNIPDLTAGRTIAVKVNAAAVPPIAGGGATVWSYDATANRLIFEPAYVPAPGDAVTATYFVACIP